MEVKGVLGLLPTAKNKMGAASLEMSYGKKQVSVTRLMLDSPDIIDFNTACVKGLVESVLKAGYMFSPVKDHKYASRIANEVPWRLVNEFLTSFRLAQGEDGTFLDFDRNDILKYISKKVESGNLEYWNIGIISLSTDSDSEVVQLSGEIALRTVNRSRTEAEPVNGAYNIKAISSKTDRRIDLSEDSRDEYSNRKFPLILIYGINGNSFADKKGRSALYQNIEHKRRNPFAYSIIFPVDNFSTDRWKQQIDLASYVL